MDLRKFNFFAFLLNLGILATTVEGTQLFFSSLAVAIYMCRFLYLTKMLLFLVAIVLKFLNFNLLKPNSTRSKTFYFIYIFLENILVLDLN